MAISTKTATLIKSAFMAADGNVIDMHNGGHRVIKLAGLVVAKDTHGGILRIGGFLTGKDHCINSVGIDNGKVVLTPNSISGGILGHQATDAEAVVKILNANERTLAEEVFGIPQTTFWSVL